MSGKVRAFHRSAGFTLLELLVVVGILAALVALALPYYQDYVNQSKLTAAQTDLKTFAKALAMYDQLEPTSFGVSGGDLRTLIGKYLQDYRTTTTQTIPRDPWGNDYYVCATQGTIVSAGPNGVMDPDSRINVAPDDDDIMVTWKPGFFVSSARAVSNTVVEAVYSRKVSVSGSISGVTGGGGGASTAVQKISDTIFRYTIPTMTQTGGTHEATFTGVTAQDNANTFSTRPDGSLGGVASFTY